MKFWRLALPVTCVVIATSARADQLISDDLIVSGSACVGLDCTNGQAFGFDTLVLKENNVRLLFLDTSSTSSFPSTDWALVANDSQNGGRNRFSIEDRTAGSEIFTIAGNAPPQALAISAAGRVGLGTGTPDTELHVRSGDTPTIRLDQSNAQGWAAQVWDIGGNETNFFVRDVESRALPFRIMSGAPQDTLVIDETGQIGLGSKAPNGKLHIQDDQARPTSSGTLVLEHRGSADSNLVQMTNEGAISLTFADTSAEGTTWVQSYGPNLDVQGGRAMRVGELGEAPALVLTHDGNLQISGTLSSGSSQSWKKNIQEVDAAQVLEMLRQVPVARWQYKNDASESDHVGPMAEDFYAAFGLGADAQHLAPADLAGVAFASVKALATELEETNDELRALHEENDALRARLDRIERLLRAR